MGRGQAAIDELQQAVMSLRHVWRGTEAVWNDTVRQRFSSAHMEPLETEASMLLRDLQRLDEVLSQSTQRMRTLP